MWLLFKLNMLSVFWSSLLCFYIEHVHLQEYNYIFFLNENLIFIGLKMCNTEKYKCRVGLLHLSVPTIQLKKHRGGF